MNIHAITAGSMVLSGVNQLNRPVCKYPQTAVYEVNEVQRCQRDQKPRTWDTYISAVKHDENEEEFTT
jgi:hypothetical protein